MICEWTLNEFIVAWSMLFIAVNNEPMIYQPRELPTQILPGRFHQKIAS